MDERDSTRRIAVGVLLWGAGTIVSSWMTLVVLKQLAAHGLRANIGWGVVGLMLVQPPATLAVLIGAALLWRWRLGDETAVVEHQLAELKRPQLGPYRTTMSGATKRASRWSPRWVLLAGLVWSCIAYVGLLFDNSGC